MSADWVIEAGFDTRVKGFVNASNHYGTTISSLDELADIYDAEFLRMPNFGRISLKRMRSRLSDLGFYCVEPKTGRQERLQLATGEASISHWGVFESA
jgi:hypothetical protein